MVFSHLRRLEGYCSHAFERWRRRRSDGDYSFSLGRLLQRNSATDASDSIDQRCRSSASSVKTIALVLACYVFSIGLTFYNSWLFKDFHYPLITSSLHFLTIFVLCGISRSIIFICQIDVPTLSWEVYMKRVFLTGVASAVDIGLSNWSFVYITISLYTMVKSSSIIFILAFTILFKLEKARWSLVTVVGLIATGLFLFVYKSTQFNLKGFLLVSSAAFIGGLRWTLSQVLSQKQELGLRNPIHLMWHLQPTMFIGLFPLSLALEGLPFFTSESTFAADALLNPLTVAFKIVFGGVIAFFLGFLEYLLLSNTSSLTLSICGIFKQICTLLLASHYNHDYLSPLNWVGFMVCILGIALHVYLKSARSEATETVVEEIGAELLGDVALGSDFDSNSDDGVFHAKGT